MTKWLWFKLLAVLSLVAVIVGICVLEDRLVKDALTVVNTRCYEIETAIEKNKGIVNGEVASLVDNLEYEWFKREQGLCFLVNHKNTEQLGVEIVRLKTYIDEEEEIEFYVSLNIIKNYVETFQHFMGASVDNIL